MGNSSSAKNRHASGDDTAPTLTAGRLGDSAITDDGEMFAGNIGTYQSRPQVRVNTRIVSVQHCSLLCGLDNSPRRKRAMYMAKKRVRSSTITPGGDPTLSTAGRALPTVIKWEGGGKDVYIAGSFNNWKSRIPLVKSHGDFYTIVDLPEGDHQYKFYVDGQWIHNPNEPTSNNEMGTLNNVVKVKKTDFEVFEALAIDSRTTNTSRKHQETPDTGSPPTDYGQDIPVRRTDIKQPGPPILPPQLLQVILNKDTPAHCEPTLLPEPNHVMLNHLYALSIKDGVMVLSATHRFRKKYVTTLLYKPI